MTPFFRAYPLLYHKCGSMVILRPGNLSSLYSPENRIIRKLLIYLTKKVDNAKVVILLEVVVMNRDIIKLIYF